MEVISIPAVSKVRGSVRIFSVFPDVLKYRDPLYLLLDYIAEVGILALCFVFADHNTPDLDMNHAASI
jgi:hypothetical protein